MTTKTVPESPTPRSSNPWIIARAADEIPAEWDRETFAEIAPYIQERLVRFDEVPGKVDFLFWTSDAPIEYDEPSWTKAFGPEWARPLLDDLITEFATLGAGAGWTADALKAATEHVMERYELKLGKVQAVPRVAVTGRQVARRTIPVGSVRAILGQSRHRDPVVATGAQVGMCWKISRAT